MSEDSAFYSTNCDKPDHTFVGALETILLREIRKATALYCSDDPDYHSLGINRLQWLMVAEKCKRTVPECVIKWHSLLRIYFSSSLGADWIHFQDFLKFEPHLSNHEMQNPSSFQRSQFVSQVQLHIAHLQRLDSTPEQRQNIWLKIVSESNTITPGAIMSVINWQKYWVMMKQHFGTRLRLSQSKAPKYTDEELRIMRIFGLKLCNYPFHIIAALGSNCELGTNKEMILPRCEICQQQPNEILLNGVCSECCKKPICCTICAIGKPMIKHNLSGWSKGALDLLPTYISCFREIFICTKCSDDLKCKIAIQWIVCRICETKESILLEPLYGEKIESLRKDFEESLQIELKENDGLPAYICKKCKVQIYNLNVFVKTFKQTERRLKELRFIYFIDEGELLYPPVEKLPVKGNNGQESNIQTGIKKPLKKKLSGGKPVMKNKPLKCKEVVVASIIKPKTEQAIKEIQNQAGKNLAAGCTNGTISKPLRFKSMSNPAPKTIGVIPKEKSTLLSLLSTQKPQDLIPLLRKCRPNITINLKPITASKPAIFTINKEADQAEAPSLPEQSVDYETIDDAPPVFCIPKHNIDSDTNTKLIDFNPIAPTVAIKTETVDDDNPVEVFSNTTSNCQIEEPTNNFETPLEKNNSVEFEPQMYLNPFPTSSDSESAGTVRIRCPVVRKNTIFITKPINVSNELFTKVTPNTGRARRQGVKKRRKYWGTVDEFQIAPLIAKTEHEAVTTASKKLNIKKVVKLADKRSADGTKLNKQSNMVKNPANDQIQKELKYHNFASGTLESYRNQNSMSTNKILSENLKLKLSFRLKKLRIKMRRDKRVPLMASNYGRRNSSF